ncbi:MAG: Lrp/AsnC family transcriptional regulator [Burkholderiales bacterium]|nr:Lrp/AsnC family transcriptional regulator [Burkholderiales bacterium]
MDRLTEIDLRILELLQIEGDIRNVQLAELVALSPSPCLQRVRKLRKRGYIAGVSAIVNLGKIAPHVVVHCSIRLSEQTIQQYRVFEAAVHKIPEIVECSLISGDYDYLLKIVVRDMQDFHEILNRMMEMNIGIKNHASNVEVRSVKRSLAMPLRSLLKDPL